MRVSSVLLIILAILSLTLVTAHQVSGSETKLPPPVFTLKPTTNNFSISPTSTINPYTGENETSPSYSGVSRGIEITIKNQPFTPYTDADGNLINVYYNVSFKGHFGDVWGHYPDATYEDLFNASTSTYTIINVSMEPYPSIPDGGQLDFRLQALIGYYNYNTAPSGTKYVTGFTALETSDWSNTQTVTLTRIYSTSPNPSPTIPEFSAFAILSLMVALFCAVLLSKNATPKT